MDLAINHSCTSSAHDLQDWYLAVARNTRSHGKPAWCNESGRERRHRNDDPVHRRKQAWLWYAAGCHWTWHSWDGCEGINDLDYRAPGEEFLSPLIRVMASLPFWRMAPNQTAAVLHHPSVIQTALASPDRDHILLYCCARETGHTISEASLALRLPDGSYRVSLIDPSKGASTETRTHTSKGLGDEHLLRLPAFVDDLTVHIERVQPAARTAIPGTH
jgi:hypothetical protein